MKILVPSLAQITSIQSLYLGSAPSYCRLQCLPVCSYLFPFLVCLAKLQNSINFLKKIKISKIVETWANNVIVIKKKIHLTYIFIYFYSLYMIENS